MESGFCVAKIMSSQRFLHSSSDDRGPSKYSTKPFESAPSSPGRECLRKTEASKESFGEVLAAIPFNWEVVPGRPKLQSSMNSGSVKGRGVGGGGGAAAASANEVFDEPPRIMPSLRRPLICRSNSALHLGARFQAEMLATSSTVGNSRAEDLERKMARDRRLLAYKSTSAFHLSRRFEAEILATRSVGYIKPDSDNFVKGQLLPLPPRLRTPKLLRIAPDSSDAFPQYTAGNKNTWGAVEREIPEPIHGSYHRRARSAHTPIERFGKEPTTTTLESEFGAGDDGSPKLMWPFLKEKIRWRSGSGCHRLTTNNFAQRVANTEVLDQSKENFRILATSPQLHTGNVGVVSKPKLEKENDGRTPLLSTASFQKLPAVTTMTGSKSNPSSRKRKSCEQQQQEIFQMINRRLIRLTLIYPGLDHHRRHILAAINLIEAEPQQEVLVLVDSCVPAAALH